MKAVGKLGRTIRRPFQSPEQRDEEYEMRAIRRRNKLMRLNFRQQEQNPFQLDPELVAELTAKPLFEEPMALETDFRKAGIKSFEGETEQKEKMPHLRLNANRMLGKGGFGVVFRGKLHDKETGEWTDVAIKTCKLKLGQYMGRGMKISSAIREYRFWQTVSGHPNIAFLFDVLRVRDRMWFVVELLHGDMCDLQDTYPHHRYPLIEARKFFRQIVAGINFMHSRCVAHLDMKLENVLVVKVGQDFICKISDFGLSQVAWTTQHGIIWCNNNCGTMAYMPPEMLFERLDEAKLIFARKIPKKKGETDLTPKPDPTPEEPLHIQLYRKYLLNVQSGMRRKTTRKTLSIKREYDEPDQTNGLNHDTWALGVLLFVMVTGVYPNFVEDREGLEQMLVSLMKGHVPKFRFIPQVLREFMRCMLEPDPAKRATIRDIAGHDWLLDNPPSRGQRNIEQRVQDTARFEPEVVPGPETGAVPKGRHPVASPAVAEVYDQPSTSSSGPLVPPRYPFQDLTPDDFKHADACLMDSGVRDAMEAGAVVDALGESYGTELAAARACGITVLPDAAHAIIGRTECCTIYKGMKLDDIALPADKAAQAKIYALKRITVEMGATRGRPSSKIYFEIQVLKTLGGRKGIIGFFGHQVIDSPDIGTVAQLILEYADSGTLRLETVRGVNNHLTEDQARAYCDQIVTGVHYLHRSGICHRNLTPDNILISSDSEKKRCKITGFSCATNAWTIRNGVRFLTDIPSLKDLDFAAPELLYHMAGKPNVDFEAKGLKFLSTFTRPMYEGIPVDCWSIGAILYFMLTGSTPFDTSALPAGIERILRGDYFNDPLITIQSQNFMATVFQPDPSDRNNSAQLLHNPFLKHKFTTPEKQKSPSVGLTHGPARASAEKKASGGGVLPRRPAFHHAEGMPSGAQAAGGAAAKPGFYVSSSSSGGSQGSAPMSEVSSPVRSSEKKKSKSSGVTPQPKSVDPGFFIGSSSSGSGGAMSPVREVSSPRTSSAPERSKSKSPTAAAPKPTFFVSSASQSSGGSGARAAPQMASSPTPVSPQKSRSREASPKTKPKFFVSSGSEVLAAQASGSRSPPPPPLPASSPPPLPSAQAHKSGSRESEKKPKAKFFFSSGSE